MPFHLTERQAELNLLLGGKQRHTMFVGGSRSGKTFLLTRAVLIRALRTDFSRHAILRLRANSARSTIWLDTLPKVARLCFPGLVLRDHRQDGYISLSNGSEIWIGGLDDRDRVEKILGMEFATLYFNEGSQIPYGSILVALTRLAQAISGLRQRAYYDLNPVGKGHWSYRLFIEHIDPESRTSLQNPADYVHAFLNPLDNAENLTPEYLDSLRSMPAARRRRFYSGEYVEEIEGALWTLESLERAKVLPSDVPQTLKRVVVAVDPSGTAGEDRSDEVGIVVVGLADDTAYVLADLTCNLPPESWARRVVQAFLSYKADAVIAERNFGGDMVRAVIQTAGRDLRTPVPVYMVTASRGKAVRAEPISALYGSPIDDQPTRVFHVWDESPERNFSALEEELLQFATFGYQGSRSPNRSDALVWGLTHLMLTHRDDALAAPVLVRRQIHSPDTDPAPRVEYPTPRTVTLDPSEYETITERRGW